MPESLVQITQATSPDKTNTLNLVILSQVEGLYTLLVEIGATKDYSKASAEQQVQLVKGENAVQMRVAGLKDPWYRDSSIQWSMFSDTDPVTGNYIGTGAIRRT